MSGFDVAIAVDVIDRVYRLNSFQVTPMLPLVGSLVEHCRFAGLLQSAMNKPDGSTKVVGLFPT